MHSGGPGAWNRHGSRTRRRGSISTAGSGRTALIGSITSSEPLHPRSRTMPSDVDARDIRARTLVLSRVFDAPRRVLFAAWTTPEQVAAWWGPLGYVTTHCEMDIRPGGSFRVCMRSPDGVDH